MNSHSPRLLHTMLRVRDLDAMLGFYCGVLGMREQRRIEFPEQQYRLVFIGYPGEEAAQVELWHEYAREQPHAHGEVYGHLGIGVVRLPEFCDTLRARGITIHREPAPMRAGGRAIALVRDPEGNEVELLAND